MKMSSVREQLSNWENSMSESDFTSLVEYVEMLKDPQSRMDALAKKQFLVIYGKKGKTTLRKKILEVAGVTDMVVNTEELLNLATSHGEGRPDVVVVNDLPVDQFNDYVLRLTSNDLMYDSERGVSFESNTHVIVELIDTILEENQDLKNRAIQIHIL